MGDDPRFFKYLRDRIGLDVASVGPALIERAVQQRRTASGCTSADAYWQLLQGSGTEQQALIEAVIVPETWFLRYPESFAALARLVQARLLALKGTRPVRLLSLPCSTGEEPYSIAMALFDAGVLASQFRVDGVDISPLSVAKAQRGLYGRNSFRGAELGFRERYFEVEDDGYRLGERVRQQVRLQPGNVLDPALLKGEPPYDFVFCRNLLIYFDVETQQRVFEVLKGLTDKDGALFIGPAEGSLLARLGMRPIGIAQSFAFVRDENPAPEPQPMTPWVAPPPRALPAAMPPRPRAAPIAPPLPQVAAPAAEKQVQVTLEQIASLANEGKSQAAMQACELYLKHQGPHAQAYYWLGLLNDVGGDARKAQDFYRKALYLQPQHPEALAHLAMLLAAQGDSVGARRLQERAARSDRTADSERKR
ncbi:protein-glutamate O-methyltransferase CheR [Pseudomonas sp. App30]|uniref:CheR family methyltransferase n=1 Tax=Pseudomonas sp. App30 TaxID=3068990 RepID=UPI003A802037